LYDPLLIEALDRYLTDVSPMKKGYVQERIRIEAWKRQPLALRSMSAIT
jgi:hypothetical protein